MVRTHEPLLPWVAKNFLSAGIKQRTRVVPLLEG